MFTYNDRELEALREDVEFALNHDMYDCARISLVHFIDCLKHNELVYSAMAINPTVMSRRRFEMYDKAWKSRLKIGVAKFVLVGVSLAQIKYKIKHKNADND